MTFYKSVRGDFLHHNNLRRVNLLTNVSFSSNLALRFDFEMEGDGEKRRTGWIPSTFARSLNLLIQLWSKLDFFLNGGIFLYT